MSLYDEAAVALIAEGAAGKDGVLYNIKPEEKLKATELITEGGFENNNVDSNWGVSLGNTGALSVSNNEAVFSGVSGDNSVLFQNDVFEVGKTYKVSLTLDIREGAVKIGTGGTGQANAISDGNIFTQGKHNHSFYYTVVETSEEDERLVIARGTSPYDFTVDNVSVKEVEQKPLDFTFTRGSNLTATRVGPDGYIEKGRVNEVTNSNDFSVAGGSGGWYRTSGSATTHLAVVTSGQSGYDGSTNAWKLEAEENGAVPAGSDQEAYMRHQSTNNGVQTFSAYVKAGNVDYVRLIGLGNIPGGSTSNANGWFYLSGSGSVPTKSNVIDATIKRVGSSDWYRCAITFNRTLVTGVRIQIADGDGVDFANSAKVSPGDYIFVQNAQLEYGLVATEYIDSKSTTGEAGILEDSPRFDYTGGGCPHLLMEPTRKNLLPYSEYVGAWTGSQTTASFEISPDLSPEGVKNAYRVTRSASGTQVGAFATIPDEVKKYTGSIWVKRVSGSTTCKLLVTENVAVTKNITDDWTRIEETVESTSGNTTGRLYIQPAADGDVIDIYGAQLEEGSYSTSYIPNHGTSAGVTRDNEFTPSTDFGDYIDGEDFTFFVDLAKNESLLRDNSSGGVRFSSTNLTASSVRLYRASGSATTYHAVWFDSELKQDPDPKSFSGSTPKVAIRRIKSTGEWAMFVDGSKVQTQYNTNYSDFKHLKIWGEGSPVHLNGTIVFDRALTDDECIALTT